MKRRTTLALAASILTLTLAGFSHVAAADTGTTTQATTAYARCPGGSPVKYVNVIVTAINLISGLMS